MADLEPMYIVLILIVVAGGLVMLAAVLMGQRADERRRMEAIIAGRSEIRAGNEKDERDRRRSELARKLRQEESASKKQSDKSVNAKIRQAGLSISPQQFWGFSLMFAAICAGGAKLTGFSAFVVAMAGITGLFGIPRLVLGFLIKRRQRKFLEEFADALESMVRLLKAGMPVGEAIAMVGREYTGPVGEEMQRIYDTQKIGVPMAEAVLEAGRRMPLTEMQMFATGVAIQQQTGSSLSEILSNLANVIRARHRLKRKVEALSSEAKASAGIIGALPPLVAGGLYLINPDFMEILFIDPTGRLLLTGAGVWMGIGIMVMRQMINFRV